MTEVILCAISEDVCENSDGFDLLAESFHQFCTYLDFFVIPTENAIHAFQGLVDCCDLSCYAHLV